MKLREEIELRRIIRRIIETRIKPNIGWEGYSRARDADNHEIDAGYNAAYYEQYNDAVMGLDRIAELEPGGENVITRRDAKRDTKKKK